MSDRNKPTVHFDDLNLLGKAVYLGGSTVRLLAGVIDATLERAVDLVIETEQAFLQGRDPNVEDAKILEEHDERR